MGNAEFDITDTTAAACERLTQAGSCEGCGAEGRLRCLYTRKYLAYFCTLASLHLLPFLTPLKNLWVIE